MLTGIKVTRSASPRPGRPGSSAATSSSWAVPSPRPPTPSPPGTAAGENSYKLAPAGRAGAGRAEVQICIRESWEHRLSPFCAAALGQARSATERGKFAKRTPAALRRGATRRRAEEGRTGAPRSDAQERRAAAPLNKGTRTKAQTRGPGQGKDRCQSRGRGAVRPARRKAAGAIT